MQLLDPLVDVLVGLRPCEHQVQAGRGLLRVGGAQLVQVRIGVVDDLLGVLHQTAEVLRGEHLICDAGHLTELLVQVEPTRVDALRLRRLGDPLDLVDLPAELAFRVELADGAPLALHVTHDVRQVDVALADEPQVLEVTSEAGPCRGGPVLATFLATCRCSLLTSSLGLLRDGVDGRVVRHRELGAQLPNGLQVVLHLLQGFAVVRAAHRGDVAEELLPSDDELLDVLDALKLLFCVVVVEVLEDVLFRGDKPGVLSKENLFFDLVDGRAVVVQHLADVLGVGAHGAAPSCCCFNASSASCCFFRLSSIDAMSGFWP